MRKTIVRDRSGLDTQAIRQASHSEGYTLLRDKLREEIAKLGESAVTPDIVEHLVEMLELVHGFVTWYGHSFRYIEHARMAKYIQHGGYDNLTVFMPGLLPPDQRPQQEHPAWNAPTQALPNIFPRQTFLPQED